MEMEGRNARTLFIMALKPSIVGCLVTVHSSGVVKCICFYYLCLAPGRIDGDCLLSR